MTGATGVAGLTAAARIIATNGAGPQQAARFGKPMQPCLQIRIGCDGAAHGLGPGGVHLPAGQCHQGFIVDLHWPPIAVFS